MHIPISLHIVFQIACQIRNKLIRVFIKNYPVPWMKKREIDIIQELLLHLRPQRCLEWGSGYSTLFFPRLIKTEWHSIEHDSLWASKLIHRRPKANLLLIQPNKPFDGDGTYDEFRNYLEIPLGGKFDFIFVDGRARLECIKKAKELLTDSGVIVLHDANREMYHRSFPFDYQLWLLDYRTQVGGLWIGSNRPLSQVLDIKRAQTLWDDYRELGHTRIGQLLRV